MAVRLRGPLNVKAFRETLRGIVQRHEVLRTSYGVSEGRASQRIEPECEFLVPIDDLTHLAQEEQGAAVREHSREEALTAFDLKNVPMLRAKLLLLGEEEHVLLLTTHHIASDGWSSRVLVGEMVTLYESLSRGEPSPLPDLPVQYADYAIWQRDWLQGDVLEEQLGYWREQLADAPLLEVPTDRRRPAVATYAGASEQVCISADLTRRLRELCRAEGVTLFMALLAGWQIVLGSWAGQEDVIVGTDVANRRRPELENLIGFFTNQLVLRTNLSGDPSFRSVLERVRKVCLGAYDHQDVPFERVVEELAPNRDLARNPLFQVIFVLQNLPRGAQMEMSTLKVGSAPMATATVRFDLALTIAEFGEELSGGLAYSVDLFEAGTVRRMLRHLERVLEQMVASPNKRVGEIEMVGEDECQLLMQWNQKRRPDPSEKDEAALLLDQLEQMADEDINELLKQSFDDASS